MEQLNTLDDNSKFYKEYGAMDARNYMSELRIEGKDLLDDISLTEAKVRAESAFNTSFISDDGTLVVGDSFKISDYKAMYVASFLREVSLYKRSLQEQEELKANNKKNLRENYVVLAYAAAARWFVSMETSSDILKLKDEDLMKIATDIFTVMTINKYTDKVIKASFVGTFIKSAKLLISSLVRSY